MSRDRVRILDTALYPLTVSSTVVSNTNNTETWTQSHIAAWGWSRLRQPASSLGLFVCLLRIARNNRLSCHSFPSEEHRRAMFDQPSRYRKKNYHSTSPVKLYFATVCPCLIFRPSFDHTATPYTTGTFSGVCVTCRRASKGVDSRADPCTPASHQEPGTGSATSDSSLDISSVS